MISAIYKPAQMNPISDLGKPRESRILPPDWPPGAARELELPPVTASFKQTYQAGVWLMIWYPTGPQGTRIPQMEMIFH